MPKQKPDCDAEACGSCTAYQTVTPADEAGYCHALPPVWVDVDGVGGWQRPVVEPQDVACRFYLRKLQS